MKVVVGHLYPDYLNIYADRGNIAVLERRAAWRGIEFDYRTITVGDPLRPGEHDLLYVGGGHRVVDVVETRQRKLHVDRSLWCHELEPYGRQTLEDDPTGADVEGGPAASAVRAAVVAEVPDVGRDVLVRRPADEAVLRIRGMGEPFAGDALVVEAEATCVRATLREIRERGVVGVHDRPGVGIELAHGCPPAFGGQLELAVTVELVAEEVSEANGSRPERSGDGRKGTFVDFEEAELRAARRQEGRGDARDEVRPCAVVRKADPGREDLRHHRRRRRLAVRRGYERRAAWQPASEASDGPRVDRGEDLPRQRRAAAPPGQPRHPAGRSGERDLECKPHAASVGR